MQVEVAYANPEVQAVLSVEVPESSTVRFAIQCSGILQRFPEIQVDRTPVGVFGRVCGWDHPLRPGDRIELYRPLRADPREARRARAASTRRSLPASSGSTR